MKKIFLFLMTVSSVASVYAHSNNSNQQVCSEIREEATYNCRNIHDVEHQNACYVSEVARMVSEYNKETKDLSGGGQLRCEY